MLRWLRLLMIGCLMCSLATGCVKKKASTETTPAVEEGAPAVEEKAPVEEGEEW